MDRRDWPVQSAEENRADRRELVGCDDDQSDIAHGGARWTERLFPHRAGIRQALAPEIIPLVLEVGGFAGRDFDGPGDLSAAIEVVPPRGPAVPMPPIWVWVDDRAVLEHVEASDFSFFVGFFASA